MQFVRCTNVLVKKQCKRKQTYFHYFSAGIIYWKWISLRSRYCLLECRKRRVLFEPLYLNNYRFWDPLLCKISVCTVQWIGWRKIHIDENIFLSWYILRLIKFFLKYKTKTFFQISYMSHALRVMREVLFLSYSFTYYILYSTFIHLFESPTRNFFSIPTITDSEGNPYFAKWSLLPNNRPPFHRPTKFFPTHFLSTIRNKMFDSNCGIRVSEIVVPTYICTCKVQMITTLLIYWKITFYNQAADELTLLLLASSSIITYYDGNKEITQ